MLNDLFSIPSFEYVSGMIIFKGSAIGPGSKGHAPNKNTLRAYGLGATTDALTLKWVPWHALWATGFGVSCLHHSQVQVAGIRDFSLGNLANVFGGNRGAGEHQNEVLVDTAAFPVSLGSWNSYCL